MAKVKPLRVDGDVAVIQLQNGMESIIDLSDYDIANGKNWYASRTGGYVRTKVNYKILYLHKLIMAAPIGLVVDHIDGDTFNNRRANLRTASHAENMRNKRMGKRNSSGFKGVYFDPRDQNWRAEITHDMQRHRLGRFDSPEAAYSAYCEANKRLHGDFGRTT